MTKYHISPKTGEPALCKATIECPLGGEHYATEAEAYKSLESTRNSSFELMNSFSKQPAIELSSNIGTAIVIDGDLHDPTARALLSSGLCGDLALAIHKKTGGAPYFLSYTVSSEEDLLAKFEEDPDNIIHFTNHVMIESPTKMNHFVDAYGQSDYEDIEDNWDGAFVVEGTPEMLSHFANDKTGTRLAKFADTAIEFDKQEISYDVDDDLLDFADDYDE